MKKYIVIATLLVSAFKIQAQQWFDVGAKGGYGVSFLANSNFFNDHEFVPQISFCYMYGGKLGFNFNEDHALTLDVTASNITQTYKYAHLNLDSSKTNYNRTLGIDALNFLLMYRKASDGGYFEVGPQLITINKAIEKDDFLPGQSIDISSNLVQSYYSAVVGFGGYLAGTDNFRVVLGFRASYALNDVLSDKGKQLGFPSPTHYPNYKSINPITAMMLMELNFDVGYFARSRCKKRKLNFILFSK